MDCEIMHIMNSKFPDEYCNLLSNLNSHSINIDNLMNKVSHEISLLYTQRDFVRYKQYLAIAESISTFEPVIKKMINELRMESGNKIINVSIIDKAQKARSTMPDNISIKKFIENSNYKCLLLKDSFKHQKPIYFEFNSNFYKATTLQNVVNEICEILLSIDPNKFCDVTNDTIFNGKYFSKTKSELRFPYQIGQKDIYVETNTNAEQKRELIKKLITKFDMDVNEFKVYVSSNI